MSCPHRREVRADLAKYYREHMAAVALLSEVAKGVAHPPKQRFSGEAAARHRVSFPGKAGTLILHLAGKALQAMGAGALRLGLGDCGRVVVRRDDDVVQVRLFKESLEEPVGV